MRTFAMAILGEQARAQDVCFQLIGNIVFGVISVKKCPVNSLPGIGWVSLAPRVMIWLGT
ncbi:MAG: hypothetical protein IPL27_27100 [Lewinellaceae bacterium]|nr:hypothetical protein [Lewinellaceae bacterium]